MTIKHAADWVDARLQHMDLEGRDEFYTHLICQEIPMWFRQIIDGERIGDITWLIQRRGFTEAEASKVRALQKFFNDNAMEIKLLWVRQDPSEDPGPPPTKSAIEPERQLLERDQPAIDSE